ncbi:hypothetical protein SAY86_019203 [Trapa natans]|uniref:ENTH domain-containing protein n=1 Tax=Trapa natans TaxID=22666 RepID=A0AAN7R1M9_TRANT|nr:hypothetical protein SAY86_019203 [Trapa natans]
MPSKLKKAIGAVKDHTSISLAKVASNNEAASLEVAILKATSHDEAPMDERYVGEILHLIASNKVYAATCAYVISRRVKKTRNWTVALKSLMLVLRVFQDGDPYFPREVLHTMKRGGRILNLSTFRDHSKTNSPWDYTAYVRTFALYLEERLDCFLMGKLQRRVAFRSSAGDLRGRRPSTEPIIREMKPSMLLDRISYWQRLLDRAIATRPTGAARSNRLVQFSLHAIVQESFDLYRDTSDGLALLLDSFFHLQYQSCVNAFQTCLTAAKQFEELSEYYAICKSMGVGRTSEYPSVQKISDELIETLREFLKDQSSFPNNSCTGSSVMSISQNRIAGSVSPAPNDSSAYGLSDYGSQCTSLEDLFSVTDYGSGSTRSTTTNTASTSSTMSSPSGSTIEEDQQRQPTGDFALFDVWPTSAPALPQDPGPSSPEQCWELELAELMVQSQPEISGGLHPSASFPDNLLMPPRNNPFLDDDTAGLADLELIPFQSTAAAVPTIGQGQQQQQPFSPSEDAFFVAPTFRAVDITTPTFNTSLGMNELVGPIQDEADPFSSNYNPGAFEASTDHEQINLQQQQQQWLQNQNKIMAKHLAW